MVWIILGTLISYLLGSVPTAYIFARILKGIDIRTFGSGNVGATNALRTLGKGPGIAVLILDILKGFLAVVFLGEFLFPKTDAVSTEVLRIILGLACVFGHNWPVFLRFKGGKGIATSFGVLLGLAVEVSGLRLILLFEIFIWLTVFIFTRIVSLASVLVSIGLPVFLILFKQSSDLIFLGFFLCILTTLRHKSNLKRLFLGEEKPLY